MWAVVQCICKGDVPGLREALKCDGIDIHSYFDGNRSAIHFAAMYGHVDIIRELLRLGADPDERSLRKETPLHVVKNREAAQVLVENGASVTLKDCLGRTAFDLAFADGMDFLGMKRRRRRRRREVASYLGWILRAQTLLAPRALLAWAKASHPRLGRGSEALVIPDDLMQSIAEFAHEKWASQQHRPVMERWMISDKQWLSSVPKLSDEEERTREDDAKAKKAAREEAARKRREERKKERMGGGKAAELENPWLSLPRDPNRPGLNETQEEMDRRLALEAEDRVRRARNTRRVARLEQERTLYRERVRLARLATEREEAQRRTLGASTTPPIAHDYIDAVSGESLGSRWQDRGYVPRRRHREDRPKIDERYRLALKDMMKDPYNHRHEMVGYEKDAGKDAWEGRASAPQENKDVYLLRWVATGGESFHSGHAADKAAEERERRVISERRSKYRPR